ncbi:lipoprotein [Alkalidesulfovibrio alkalitolerans DSM 16529]|uniref:Lipoprotein n=1 Tax=Alkalidesulfovibrio alkalitolerans DSM 16529 TaxID=1121439 RepID=S7UC24_9BACT|nr:hypothetical protein [Alkalidesulfovibrio alkalitolerans]EPR31449.1 lipoprotein [Alkalidesulfovibrio alkalitolerans DSM 16529]
MPRLTLCGLLMALLLAGSMAGCAKEPPPPRDVTVNKTLAVAGFSNPRHEWELLAGCDPSMCNIVDPEILMRLNLVMEEELRNQGRTFVERQIVRRCQETVEFVETGGSNQAQALNYWIRVGECVGTDYLLLPQLMYFRDREGGEWGVNKPSSVIMYVYLLDVGNKGVARRFVFDETQEALSANLLEAGKFFERGGKWISADEMATEAIKAAIRRLGLADPARTTSSGRQAQ